MRAIEVTLDGQPWWLPAGSTLADLMRAIGQAESELATAVNGRFVPRDRRAWLRLSERDEVLLFEPIVGG